MIDVRALSFQYPDGTLIFDHMQWSVQDGEAWAVLGPSGCGKTTLLYLLAGLHKPTSGEIRVAGQLLSRPRPRTGLILQDFGLLPWASVWENAALGLRIRGFYGPDGTHAPADEVVEQLHDRVDPWLERLGIRSLAESFPGQLSGGQRQRTAIARTLALNPDLLLMDEPFAALDAPTREGLQNLILDLRKERQLTTVIVTHTIEEAALLGRKVMVLGSLPNTETLILENPNAGEGAFRETDTYGAVCNQLREMLERTA